MDGELALTGDAVWSGRFGAFGVHVAGRSMGFWSWLARAGTAGAHCLALDRAGRIASYGRVRRDVAGHHAAGSNHCVGTDGEPGQDGATRANRRTVLDQRGQALPIPVGGKPTVACGGSRPAVVGEHHAMPDKNFIFDRYASAYESMARYFASRAHLGTALDFHKAADAGVVADFAAIQVDMAGESDPAAEFDVCGDTQSGSISCRHILITSNESDGRNVSHSSRRRCRAVRPWPVPPLVFANVTLPPLVV